MINGTGEIFLTCLHFNINYASFVLHVLGCVNFFSGLKGERKGRLKERRVETMRTLAQIEKKGKKWREVEVQKPQLIYKQKF